MDLHAHAASYLNETCRKNAGSTRLRLDVQEREEYTADFVRREERKKTACLAHLLMDHSAFVSQEIQYEHEAS